MAQIYQLTFRDTESTTQIALAGANPRNVVAVFFSSEIGRSKAAAKQIRPTILALVPPMLDEPFTLAQDDWQLQILR